MELWQKSIDVNVTGAFLCSQIFGGEMLKQKSGSIINIVLRMEFIAPDQSLYLDMRRQSEILQSLRLIPQLRELFFLLQNIWQLIGERLASG